MENKNYQIILPGSGHEYSVGLNGENITIKGVNETTLSLNTQNKYDLNGTDEEQAVFLEALFGHHPDLNVVTLNNKDISRVDFYQNPLLWLRNKEQSKEEVMVETNGVQHPLRPEHFHGIHYSRFIPSINKTLSLRTITLDDLDTFHEWHNQSRVAFFWELAQEKTELKKYIEDGLAKKHQIPMIIEADGESVGYFEFYWVREDRLGPYYESRPYDRGFHFLIGNQNFLGRSNTDAVLQSALHFMYLDDQRTQFIMAEPRHDNARVLKYAEESIGWQALKVFDFPHKRAVLLQNSRDQFFKGARL